MQSHKKTLHELTTRVFHVFLLLLVIHSYYVLLWYDMIISIVEQ
jgi:hypothetical protein